MYTLCMHATRATCVQNTRRIRRTTLPRRSLLLRRPSAARQARHGRYRVSVASVPRCNARGTRQSRGCGMLRTTAGFKRMPAVVGMAIFLQYWCAPPSAVTPKAAHARLQRCPPRNVPRRCVHRSAHCNGSASGTRQVLVPAGALHLAHVQADAADRPQCFAQDAGRQRRLTPGVESVRVEYCTSAFLNADAL
jgi:hypothetical protein